MVTFLQSDSHFMVYFVATGKMHGFFHQNPLCELSGCFSTVLFFLNVPKPIDSLKEKTEKPDKVNSFFKKEKPIPGTLKFKAKYIKRRRVNGCNFIKNKVYKSILCKSMPPPPLHKSSLIFNNQLQKLHLWPKHFSKKHSNCGICQESSPAV